MSLFSRLFDAAANASQKQEVTTDFTGEAIVNVKFSVADMREIKIKDEITVKDVIESAAKLSGTDINREYTVVANGIAVDVNSKYVNRTRYAVSFSAGVAG
jgi:sulfur carrier protein ThiS